MSVNILFIADHHIKLGQKNVPKEWARSRFQRLWADVAALANSCNCTHIVHGGDIFDRLPTMEEIEIFFEMLEMLSGFGQVMYAGNHEASGKHSSWLKHFASAMTNYNCDYIDEFTQNYWEGIDILPYPDLKKNHWHGKSNKVLLTHVRGEIPPHVKPEVDLALFKGWDLVLAGDLHAHSNSQKNIQYPGSPMTNTFHRTESKGENGVILLHDSVYTFIPLNLPQLIRKTVSKAEDMIASDNHHVIYELVGDMQELKQQEPKINKELLDKKITTRASEATLNLKNKTLEEELFEYLVEVEGVKSPEEILQEFHDYIKEA